MPPLLSGGRDFVTHEGKKTRLELVGIPLPRTAHLAKRALARTTQSYFVTEDLVRLAKVVCFGDRIKRRHRR